MHISETPLSHMHGCSGAFENRYFWTKLKI